jgi:hypothetical protein
MLERSPALAKSSKPRQLQHFRRYWQSQSVAPAQQLGRALPPICAAVAVWVYASSGAT